MSFKLGAMSASFHKAWVTAFLDSKPKALLESALTFVPLLMLLYQWVFKPTTTTGQVFAAMTAFAVLLAGVVWLNASAAWAAESSRADQALQDLASENAKRPRPDVYLTYESPSLAVISSDGVNVRPLEVHNAWSAPVSRVTFQVVELYDGCRLQVVEIPVIGPLSHTHAQMTVSKRTDDGTWSVETSNNLGAVLHRAWMMGIFTHGPDFRPSWQLRCRYSDSIGRTFRREHTLEIDGDRRVVTVTPHAIEEAA